MRTPGSNTAVTTHLISALSIFFPKNSGVRPIINPEIKTESKQNIIMEESPTPIPPKMSSPSIILNKATPPAMGDKLERVVFTQPFSISVVDVDQRRLFEIPKRISFPSQLGKAFKTGLCIPSEAKDKARPPPQRISMTTKSNNPCFLEPTIEP